MKKILLCLLAFLMISCQVKKSTNSIAMDKNWKAIVLNGQEANLNGFMNDLLLEIAKKKKTSFQLIDNSSDNLLLDLKKRKYKAAFSSVEPYNFNKAKYDFSTDIIKTGYVLITSKDAAFTSLADMSNKHVGYISDSQSILFLQKYEDIFEEKYTVVPQMLDDIVNGTIEGAIISIIPAYKYVKDLYQNELKIVDPPLNDQSIRIVTLKGENTELLNLFNSSLQEMKKSNFLKDLKEKWGLPE
ncbi:MAG: L-cystine-binding protein FliY [Candidatus Anoxychlamydiales bacterium]|nr:L-cystine-binding protein FliY [Candidatus Anoxychlamydiales bacterium]